MGKTTELFFSVQNAGSRQPYVGGPRQVFTATTADGRSIENAGIVYPARGTATGRFDGVSVLPGQTGRFRVVFDALGMRGPMTVKDGVTVATLAAPLAGSPPDPIW